MAASSGGIIFPALLTAPLAALGWRYAFALTAAVALLTIVPSAWFALSRYDEVTGAHGKSETASSGIPALHIFQILRNPAFWVPLVGVVPTLFIMGAVLANAVAIAGEVASRPRQRATLCRQSQQVERSGALDSGGCAIAWIIGGYRRIFGVAAAAATVALLLLRDHISPLSMGLAFGVIGVVVGGRIPCARRDVGAQLRTAPIPSIHGFDDATHDRSRGRRPRRRRLASRSYR